jgi:hypothetical protein
MKEKFTTTLRESTTKHSALLRKNMRRVGSLYVALYKHFMWILYSESAAEDGEEDLEDEQVNEMEEEEELEEEEEDGPLNVEYVEVQLILRNFMLAFLTLTFVSNRT